MSYEVMDIPIRLQNIILTIYYLYTIFYYVLLLLLLISPLLFESIRSLPWGATEGSVGGVGTGTVFPATPVGMAGGSVGLRELVVA